MKKRSGKDLTGPTISVPRARTSCAVRRGTRKIAGRRFWGRGRSPRKRLGRRGAAFGVAEPGRNFRRVVLAVLVADALVLR